MTTAESALPPARRTFLPSFGTQVIIGLLLGLALGIIAQAIGPGPDQGLNWLAQTLQTIGSIFVQLLRALVPPLVFTAIVASIANLRRLSNAASLVWNTLLWFAITALIAVVIGIVLGLLINPGLHTGVTTAAEALPRSTGGWLDFLKGLVPGNVLALEASTKVTDQGATTALGFNVLQLLVVSIAFGAAALQAGEKGTLFLSVNESALAVVRRILWWVIRLTPIGTVGLFGTAVAQYGWSALSQLAWFAVAIYVGLALVLFVVYPAILLAHGLNPARFFAGAWPAIQLAFVSRSSIGTLPVTEAVTEHELGVPREYASFAVPPRPRWTAAPRSIRRSLRSSSRSSITCRLPRATIC